MADFSLKYSGEKINELLDKASTALQEHQDISNLALKSEVVLVQKFADGLSEDIGNLEDGKQDKIADLDEIREGASKIAEIVDEDGYLYSNGEKVDMRFTRSLLPVGTAIPANANLNTKEYLKIGKYYCSLNVDAKTITNCPVNVAFSMEVFNPLGTNVDDEDTREYTYRMRVLTQYDTGQQYMQFCRTSGTPGTWTYDSWYITTRAKFTLASSKNDGSAAVGSATQGAYVDSTGTLTKMTYTLAKSVPSNAVFTDAKVTAVENHYAPVEDESAVLNAADGEVVTGIKRDAAGHVVGLVSSAYSGGEGSSAYIASFTVEDLNRSLSSQEFIDLADRDEMLAAISNNRLVLVPHTSSGYGIMVPDIYTTRVSVITAFGDVYGFDISGLDFIVESEWSTNILDKQDKIDDLAVIREGAALGKTALQEEQHMGTVSAVDVFGGLEDPVEYATKAYVDNAIIGAINNNY